MQPRLVRTMVVGGAQTGAWQEFPGKVEAAKVAGLISCFPGYDGQQSDAEQAYTQAWLGGTETWVRLPRDQWPQK